MHFCFGMLLPVSTGIMPTEEEELTTGHPYLNAMDDCSMSEYQSSEFGLLKDPR